MNDTSQFAHEMHCLHCGKRNPASKWPEFGDVVPFFCQVERGTHNLTMNCPHCERAWHVVWDEYPGEIKDLGRDADKQQESSSVGSPNVSDSTKTESPASSTTSSKTRIRFRCSKCSSTISISSKYAGMRRECPRCGLQLTIPVPKREETVWYRKVSDQVVGPLTSRELKKLASNGSLSKEELVKKGSMGVWVKATGIKGLFASAGTKQKKPAGIHRPKADQKSSRGQNISDDQVLDLLSDEGRSEDETISPSTSNQSTSHRDSINEQIAWSFGIVPLECERDVLKVGIAAGNASHILEKSAMLEFILGRPIKTKMIPMWELRETIERLYPSTHRAELEKEIALLVRSLAGAPINRVVRLIFSLAIRNRASAILLFPGEDSLEVFLRMQESECPYKFTSLPKQTGDYIIKRLKEDVSADGAIMLPLEEGHADFAVGFRPTPLGDGAILDLDRTRSLFDETAAIGFFEDKRLTSGGMCSDDQCPCPDVAIPRGQGYLYIPEDIVEFRWCYRELVEAERHKDEAVQILSINGLPALVRLGPILVCEQGARLRNLDLEVAEADARRWWRTGNVPLRATPLNQSAEKRQECRRTPEGETKTSSTTRIPSPSASDPSFLDLPEKADPRDLDWLEKNEPQFELAKLNDQMQSDDEGCLRGMQLVDSMIARVPDLWILYSWATKFRLKVDRVSEARELLEKGLQSCPQRTYLYQGMADVAKRAAKLPEALGWSIKSVMAAHAIGIDFDKAAMCLILQVAEFHGNTELSRHIRSQQSTELTADAIGQLQDLYQQCSLDEKSCIGSHLTIFESRYADIHAQREANRQQALAELGVDEHSRRCPEHGSTYRLIDGDGDIVYVRCDQCGDLTRISATVQADQASTKGVVQTLSDATFINAEDTSQTGDSPLVRLVTLCFQEAKKLAASEIRLVPQHEGFVLQLVIADKVQTRNRLPAELVKRIRHHVRGMTDVRGQGIIALQSGEIPFRLRAHNVAQGDPFIIELPSQVSASRDSKSLNAFSSERPSLNLQLGSYLVDELINDQIAFKHEVLPLAIDGDVLEIAIADENRRGVASTEELLTFLLERPVRMVHVPEADLQNAISREYRCSRETGYETALEMALNLDRIFNELCAEHSFEMTEEIVRRMIRLATENHVTSMSFFPDELGTEVFVHSKGECSPCEISWLTRERWSVISTYLAHNTRRDGKLLLTFDEAHSYFSVDFKHVTHGQAVRLRLSTNHAIYRGCPHCGRNLVSTQASKISRIVRKLDNHQTNEKTSVLEATICPHCSSMTFAKKTSHVLEAWRLASCQQCGVSWTYPGIIICPQCEYDHSLLTPRVRPKSRPALVFPFAAQQWPEQG